MVESKKLQIALLAVIVVIALIYAKIVNSGLQHWKVLDAILDYKLECIMEDKPCFVEYDDREKLSDTFWRLWDWSEKRILPEDKYRTIKPYIGQLVSSEFLGQYFE